MPRKPVSKSRIKAMLAAEDERLANHEFVTAKLKEALSQVSTSSEVRQSEVQAAIYCIVNRIDTTAETIFILNQIDEQIAGNHSSAL